nr:rod-binding protein [Pantoea sp. A4]
MQNLAQAAEQFDALFLRMLLKEMRRNADLINSDSGLFSSRESKQLRDYHDDMLAQTLASQRSTGIAQLLEKQLAAAGSTTRSVT